jgi:hypothetical protein
MIMDALRNVLTRLQQQGAALGHFNVADLVLLKAVVAAAVEVSSAPEGWWVSPPRCAECWHIRLLRKLSESARKQRRAHTGRLMPEKARLASFAKTKVGDSLGSQIERM